MIHEKIIMLQKYAKIKKLPLISISIPYYNDAKFLHDSIKSVLQQTYKNFELILINHASIDGSRDIARSFKDDRIIHIDMEKNLGGSGGNLLKAFLAKAHGEYIKIFCADDIMLPDCLKMLLNVLLTNKSDVVFADMQYINAKGTLFSDVWSKVQPYCSFNNTECDLLKLYVNGISTLPCPTVLAKKSLFEMIVIDNVVVFMNDMIIFVQFLMLGARFSYYNDVLVLYRVHKGQVSALDNYVHIVHGCQYELFSYFDSFYYNINIQFLKSIISELHFEHDVELENKIFSDYLISLYIIRKSENQHGRYFAYKKIHAMMHDETIKTALENCCNFGIKEFRQLYVHNGELSSENIVYDPYANISIVKRIHYFLKRIYNMQPKELSFLNLLLCSILKPLQSIRKYCKTPARRRKRYTI